MNPIYSYITVSEVFPDTKSNFDNFRILLNGLSKTDSIIWCSRLNMIICNAALSHSEKQQFGIKQFLSNNDINILKQSIQKRGKKNVALFFRGQILELLRWIVLFCDDKPNDGRTFEDVETRRTFAKALLIASDIWERRIFKNWYFDNDDIEIKKKLVLGSVRKIIEAQITIPELEKTLGRGWTLFSEYLPHYYNSFYADFQEITGLSVEEYFVCIASFTTNFMKTDQTNIFNIDKLGEDEKNINMFLRYIRLEAQNANELKRSLWRKQNTAELSNSCIPEYDYRSLRDKPIFVTNDGRAIIIDPIFYCEKASIGPLFHTLKKSGEQIFAYFGYTYEKYSCDILRRMYPESNNLYKRLFCNTELTLKRGISIGEIDACLNDVNEVVLFEMKAVFIKDSAFLDDYDKLLEIIKERYGVTYKNNTIVFKGVGQLARIINEAVLNKLKINDVDFSRIQKIYPVLVVHDSLLHSPLYGEYLSLEFRELIKPEFISSDGEMTKNDIRILPLILMTIDELENLETAIEHYGIKEFLVDYSKTCSDRKVSINNFVAFSNKYSFYHNRQLASKSLDILERTREFVF